jgi:hypothetical protein
MEWAVPHKFHFICVSCRRSIKGVPQTGPSYIVDGRHVRPILSKKCTTCGGKMPCVGKRFAPPRRGDENQWKKLAFMLSQGWRGDWHNTPEMSLRDVRETQPERVEESEARWRQLKLRRDSLRATQKVQRHRARKSHLKKKRAAKDWQRVLEYQSKFLEEQKL